MVSELDKPEIYRRILESLQTGIYLVDNDQKILFWNEGAERITGHLRQDVLGRFCVDDLLGSRDGHDSFATDAADAIAAGLGDGKPVAVSQGRASCFGATPRGGDSRQSWDSDRRGGEFRGKPERFKLGSQARE